MSDGELLARDFIGENFIKTVPGTDDTARSIHIAEGLYWIWNGLVYESETRENVESKLLRWLNGKKFPDLDDRLFRWVARQLLALLSGEKGRVPGRWTDGTPGNRWVAFRNGIVNLEAKNMEISPPNPLLFNRVLIPHSYRPDAECPTWRRAVEEWMDGDQDRITMLQEFFGYCLTEDVSFCSGMFLEGGGSNGKSIFCSMLQYVLGDDNVSHVPLEQFSANFCLDQTNGKLANIANEAENDKLPTATLKKVIDGNPVFVTRKYLQNIFITPTVKVVVSWNERPKVRDKSWGFWRRLLLVPFERTFEGSEVDPFLLPKLKREASGVLNWAIEGHRRLYAQGGFSKAETVEGALREYRRSVDPCGCFVQENTRIKGGEFTPCGVLYGEYRKWCEMKELEAETENKFFRAVRRVWKKEVKKSRKSLDGVQTYGYLNLQTHINTEE